MSAPGEDPCPPFCYKHHDKYQPRWYHPHAAPGCLVTSSLPNHSKECPRRGRVVVGDVEGFTVHFWGIRIRDAGKNAFGREYLRPCNIANIDNIHLSIVV